MGESLSILAIDPGVTTGLAWFERDADEKRHRVGYRQVKGLANALDHIEKALTHFLHGHRVLIYESFYIAERTTKAEIENVRAATHVIGWLNGQYALDKLDVDEFVAQAPRERTPHVITRDVVERVFGMQPPKGEEGQHSLDAARHLVRFMVSTLKDKQAREAYVDVVEL